MKKRTITNIIAASLIVGSITSTAFAFYYKNATGNINVTLNSGSTDVAFGITEIADADSSFKLSPDNNVKTYNYTLSATKANDYKQDVAVSTLTVTFKTKNKDLYDNVTVSNVIDYTNPTITDTTKNSTYFSTETALNTMTFSEKSETASDGYYSVTGSMDAPISCIYGNKVTFTITLGNVTDETFLNIAEGAYTIDVVVSENKTYEYAYVGGIDSLGWAAQDTNMMVPNIYSSSWEWMWKADKDYGSSAIKAFQNVTPAEGDPYTTYSKNYESTEGGDSMGNLSCNIVSGDSIYWAGNSDSKVIFSHPATE